MFVMYEYLICAHIGGWLIGIANQLIYNGKMSNWVWKMSANNNKSSKDLEEYCFMESIDKSLNSMGR